VTLPRRTPLKKVGSKVRRVRETCARVRCKRPPRFAGYCASHATKIADTLFSLMVRERDGRCLNCSARSGLQCAHLVSRRYRAVRWNPDNAVALCFRCHKGFTEHPIEWRAWVDDNLAEEPYEVYAARLVRLEDEALHGEVPDVGEVIEGLRQAAA
jgi:5-methylcytosine-specific restriction endonuclease McrA